MKLKVKAMREGAKLPTRGTELAGGLDLYCCGDTLINERPRKFRQALPSRYLPVTLALFRRDPVRHCKEQRCLPRLSMPTIEVNCL